MKKWIRPYLLVMQETQGFNEYLNKRWGIVSHFDVLEIIHNAELGNILRIDTGFKTYPVEDYISFSNMFLCAEGELVALKRVLEIEYFPVDWEVLEVTHYKALQIAGEYSDLYGTCDVANTSPVWGRFRLQYRDVQDYPRVAMQGINGKTWVTDVQNLTDIQEITKEEYDEFVW